MEADRGGVINSVLFILTIALAWRGFDFYRNNSGQIFFDDLQKNWLRLYRLDGTYWWYTICPDGTLSPNIGDTCVNNL